MRGLRFGPDAGPLAEITAPPYDVISPSQREELAAKNPHNVVRLTLPEGDPDARSKFVKYANSAAQLEAWRREGVIARDEEPSLYRYTQTYTIPGVSQPLTRTKLVVLIKVEPYSAGVVLPHEKTFPKHKEDRLRILEATRSHLESIFGLFEDEGGTVHSAIASAPAEEVGEFTDPDGVAQKFERIHDPKAIAQLVDLLANKRVWIADGHHRYETALAFREQAGEQAGLIAEDFMMIGLCSISDPGLVLLPTHRILKTMPVAVEDFLAALSPDFEIVETPNHQLMESIAQISAEGGRAFGIVLPGGTGRTAKVRSLGQLVQSMNMEGSDRLKGLDVSVLHQQFFGKALGLSGVDFFSYTRVEQEALDAVENGAPAAFLMNPPTVDDMRAIAEGGEVMPQKSTYYYPKLLSGLVMWSLKDF